MVKSNSSLRVYVAPDSKFIHLYFEFSRSFQPNQHFCGAWADDHEKPLRCWVMVRWLRMERPTVGGSRTYSGRATTNDGYREATTMVTCYELGMVGHGMDSAIGSSGGMQRLV